MALERKGRLLPLGGLRHVWLARTALDQGRPRPCGPAETGAPAGCLRAGPGRAVSRALNHRAELLVLPSPPQGDRSRRVQRPRRSHGAAVSLSAWHASGPGPRSDVTPRAAKRSGQLRPGDKAPPIRRPNAASAHGFSRFRGFARCGRCFAVPRLQPDGPGQPGSHARRLVSRQPRWQPRALVSQPRSFPGGGRG